jgi:methyl-accepting chemotaxis protein
MDTVSAALRADADSVRNQADALLVTAETASQTSTTVAAAASHATSNVATAATAAGELSESVRDIARRVGEAASVTHHAVHEAEATGQVVAGLSEAATRIAKVVSLINGVAGQTNLLALNATIEAARAGEAGKGFAVVASEVKALAHQTAQATEDIQSHVASIRAETDRAVAAIGEIGKIIGTVNELTVTIAQAVERQGAATLEIATSVERAAAGTAEVSASISQVMTANRNTRDAVSHLVGLADDLSGRSGGLRNEVGHFLSDLHHAHG